MEGSLSLERGLTILELLSKADEPLGVREIARRISLSSSGVQRLVNTLAEKGLVEQTGHARRYQIGHGILNLARKMLQQDRLVALAEVELQRLAASDMNAFLGMRRGNRAVYLSTVQSSGPLVIRAIPGEPMLLHSTALGKALMLDWTSEQIVALDANEPFVSRTPRTITDPVKLAQQLTNSRDLGYTTSLNENLPGVYSIGAPIRDASGAIVAAISVAFSRAAKPRLSIPEVGQWVIAAARAVETSQGVTSPPSERAKEKCDVA
ncbi:transcriptional regulator, IclR family [Agrobacterium fabrum]|uniref:Transcriptional regulator, IclR family n=1 Tax=Agrobacterium fabrum TaxID=1176649 RepID=A0A7Z7BRW2_9HYPH|nr:IclR family transcriptional regulator [Agrobacterium fabrum]SDK34221.1 transcriptional regulator, IclR family [Agrobacterium fabrum]